MTTSNKLPYTHPPCSEKWQAGDGETWCTIWYIWDEEGECGPCLDFAASEIDTVTELVKAAESVTYAGSVWCTICHLGICFNFLEHDRQAIITLLQELKAKPAQNGSGQEQEA